MICILFKRDSFIISRKGAAGCKHELLLEVRGVHERIVNIYRIPLFMSDASLVSWNEYT